MAYAGHLIFSKFFLTQKFVGYNYRLFGFEFDLLFLMCCCLFIGAMGKSAQIPLHVGYLIRWRAYSNFGFNTLQQQWLRLEYSWLLIITIFELSQSALSIIFIIGGFTAFLLEF